ncbi:MAG: hypothetical protein M0P71_09105 [Melioribacteraceae bacterium]|nr:hypothetical protein [Melioribacteraceae bacterium]
MKNIMKLLLLVVGIIIISCDKSTTESEARIKTPDEMTWTVDTFRTAPTDIQIIPEDIIAFSPKDVWIAFYSGGLTELVQHYNGKEWNGYKAGQLGGRINALAGKSSHDIWAVGYDGNGSCITHYDGMSWTPYSERWPDEIIDITKDDEGNYWACGRSGIILKYSGNKWKGQYFKINLNPSREEEYLLGGIAYYNKKIHLLGRKSTSGIGSTEYHIVGEFNNWTVIDSQKYSEFKTVKFGDVNFINIDNNLYSFGLEGIWEYKNSNWEQILKLNQQIFGMSGINQNYLIAVGPFNKFYFYDGNSWVQKAYNLKTYDDNMVFDNVWTNGIETFIVGEPNIGRYALVWHGK